MPIRPMAVGLVLCELAIVEEVTRSAERDLIQKHLAEQKAKRESAGQ